MMDIPPVLFGIISLFVVTAAEDPYYGKHLGNFINQEHNVHGEVYAAGERTLVIHNFTYDGAGPDAFFWVGKKRFSSPRPAADGLIVPDENGDAQTKLKAYNGATLVLQLPSDLPLNQLMWISVWCRQFSVNFGYLLLRNELTIDLPRPRRIGQFSSRAHGVRSGPVTVLDAKTIRIQNFQYDGTGPDAYFLAGKGSSPAARGKFYKVPDENGSTGVAHGYQGETINLVLPEGVNVFGIDWLSLYCIQYSENFGEVFFRPDVVREGDIVPHLGSLPVGVSVDGNHGRQGYVPQNGRRQYNQHNPGQVSQNGRQGYVSQNGQRQYNQHNPGQVSQNGHNQVYQANGRTHQDFSPRNSNRRTHVHGAPQRINRSHSNRFANRGHAASIDYHN